jgi:hypothetical protein
MSSPRDLFNAPPPRYWTVFYPYSEFGDRTSLFIIHVLVIWYTMRDATHIFPVRNSSSFRLKSGRIQTNVKKKAHGKENYSIF